MVLKNRASSSLFFAVDHIFLLFVIFSTGDLIKISRSGHQVLIHDTGSKTGIELSGMSQGCWLHYSIT